MNGHPVRQPGGVVGGDKIRKKFARSKDVVGQLRALASGRFLEDNDCRSSAEIRDADLYQDISGLSNSSPVERYQLHKFMQRNRLA